MSSLLHLHSNKILISLWRINNFKQEALYRTHFEHHGKIDTGLEPLVPTLASPLFPALNKEAERT